MHIQNYKCTVLFLSGQGLRLCKTIWADFSYNSPDACHTSSWLPPKLLNVAIKPQCEYGYIDYRSVPCERWPEEAKEYKEQVQAVDWPHSQPDKYGKFRCATSCGQHKQLPHVNISADRQQLKTEDVIVTKAPTGLSSSEVFPSRSQLIIPVQEHCSVPQFAVNADYGW